MSRWFLFALAAVSVIAAGCGAKEETDGYKKTDFQKKPVPPGFGPGGGAPATPPPSVGK